MDPLFAPRLAQLAPAAEVTTAAAPYPPGTFSLPDWAPTWDMAQSTIIMPCNYTGLVDPAVYTDFGLVDFDWSNGRSAWSSASPMNDQELLLRQAQAVKAATPSARVFVYRNLVKALPWYSQVREKMLDPAYAGWFLRYSDAVLANHSAVRGGAPPCTGGKCSEFYHDQEQTPQLPGAGAPTRAQDGAWYVYNNTNDVMALRPGYATIVDAGPAASWQGCRAAADAFNHSQGRKVFTWWPTTAAVGGGDCWLSSDWHTKAMAPGGGTMPVAQALHVSGYKPGAGEAPPPAMPSGLNTCLGGVCDCGEGLPCGEYLWDHRNASLRSWLVDEFVLGAESGLGNPAIDGFYFDDSWHAAPGTPPKAPWGGCSRSPVGGATEEDGYCAIDMGLGAADVAAITAGWSATADAAKKAVLANKGFTWGASSLFVGTGARVAQADTVYAPHTVKDTCMNDLRTHCVPRNESNWASGAFIFELTRKTFHDPFPLPYVVQDVASFLLTRGPFAWLGHNWMGCLSDEATPFLRPVELDVDYGVPVDEHCAETAAGSGIFVREWSKVHVEMDCNSFVATLNAKP